MNCLFLFFFWDPWDALSGSVVTTFHPVIFRYSFTGRGCLSGFGFELTFRLKKVEGETSPPMWPTTLLNKLAAYVFHTGIFYIFSSLYLGLPHHVMFYRITYSSAALCTMVNFP
jgi:hypothetical protein